MSGGLLGIGELRLWFWSVCVSTSVSGSGGLKQVLSNGLGMWGLGCLWWQVLALHGNAGVWVVFGCLGHCSRQISGWLASSGVD